MHCPYCGVVTTRVIDSRLASDGDKVRRRRVCLVCNERFTTYEIAQLKMPCVIKSNKVTQVFSDHKLRDGMLRALEKRPVSQSILDSAIIRLKKRLLTSGVKEVSSKQIGNYVMDELRLIDDVAYIRFASVYHSFNNLEEFREIIHLMESQ